MMATIDRPCCATTCSNKAVRVVCVFDMSLFFVTVPKLRQQWVSTSSSRARRLEIFVKYSLLIASQNDRHVIAMANTYWLQDGYEPLNVCFGSGRFLRSVLVPALQESPPVIVQTRGRSFLDHCNGGETTGQSYQVDTVRYDGSIQTDSFRVGGVFSLGVDADAVWNILVPACARSLRIVGVGVTEQGLANAETTAMKDLYRFFQELAKASSSATTRTYPICVINTDNVPWNGRVLQSHMATRAADDPVTRTFLADHVVFLNSMVDRITSHRPDDPDVPRAEPIPAKALVVLDETAALPSYFLHHDGLGVVRRSTEQQLNMDIALKLRIANGTHTAVAHVMALCGMARTDALLHNVVLLSYLDAFVHQQVISAIDDAPTKKEALAVWEDWRARLTHQYFGLCTYFITQNGAAKGGIRFGPTVVDLIQNGRSPVTQSTVFAYAALLRWLTCDNSIGKQSGGGVYRGKLCRSDANHADTVTYADGLQYNRAAGWYEFRCACLVDGKSITEWLDDDSNGAPQQPEAYKMTIRKYLLAPDGGNLGAVERSSAELLDQLVGAIAVVYARMVAGDDPLEILGQLHSTGALNKGI
jgi:mannitol-1-phosphate/altronate dehydrogenase